jgi:hypothetical protein
MIDQDKNQENYSSHKWKTDRYSSAEIGIEYVTTCYECGIENMGDPSEFPEMEYPNCNEVEYP